LHARVDNSRISREYFQITFPNCRKSNGDAIATLEITF